MAKTLESPKRPNNWLLAALPDDVFARIAPDLQTISAPLKHVFQKQGERIEHVHFLNGGVGSIATVLENGTMVETATVGMEGMLGIEAFFGVDPISPADVIMQVPGSNAEKMSVRAFHREIARHGAFFDVMGRYASITIAQIMQSTACNATHGVQERCARWLLQTHDRMGQRDFQLSHEFLAVMLGVRRQTVSVVAGTLQRAGLIQYTHGRVSVLDRVGLEESSCECYQVMRRRFDELGVKINLASTSATAI